MPKTGQCRARACNAEDWAPMPCRGLQCRAGARNAEAATVGSGQICHRQASQCHVPQRHMCAKLTHPVSRILEKCREIGTKYVHKMLHVWPKLTQMISSHIVLNGNFDQSGKFLWQNVFNGGGKLKVYLNIIDFLAVSLRHSATPYSCAESLHCWLRDPCFL